MNLPPLLRRRLDDARLWARRHADAISAWLQMASLALASDCWVQPGDADVVDRGHGQSAFFFLAGGLRPAFLPGGVVFARMSCSISAV